MALWEAPITATVVAASFGRIRERRGGFKAGSRPISWMLVMGSGPVDGAEPVQSTSMFDMTCKGSGYSPSGELILTSQFPESVHDAEDTLPSCLNTPLDLLSPLVSMMQRSAAWAIWQVSSCSSCLICV